MTERQMRIASILSNVAFQLPGFPSGDILISSGLERMTDDELRCLSQGIEKMRLREKRRIENIIAKRA